MFIGSVGTGSRGYNVREVDGNAVRKRIEETRVGITSAVVVTSAGGMLLAELRILPFKGPVVLAIMGV